MTPLDILWMCCWFIVGLFTFQIRGIRSFWEEISDFSDVLTYLSLVFGILFGTLTLPNVSIGSIKSIIIGFQTMLVYLIGANISRWYQFGNMSFRIVLYVFMFAELLAIEIVLGI